MVLDATLVGTAPEILDSQLTHIHTNNNDEKPGGTSVCCGSHPPGAPVPFPRLFSAFNQKRARHNQCIL